LCRAERSRADAARKIAILENLIAYRKSVSQFPRSPSLPFDQPIPDCKAGDEFRAATIGSGPSSGIHTGPKESLAPTDKEP
jgi:hypothetical protein